MIYQTTGAKKDKRDKRDLRTRGIIASQSKYLDIFELDEKFLPKMQWGRGSCTNQAYAHHKERQEQNKMSARYGMAKVKTDIEHNTGYGGYTRNGFKSGSKVGIASEEKYPEPNNTMGWKEYIDASLIPSEVDVDALKHKSESYWRVDKTLTDIKDILITGKSVVISMAWFSVFNSPMLDGTLPSYDMNARRSGHAVDICGWNDKSRVLKIKNSWSKNWGKYGYFYMPYDYMTDLIWDLWTSLDIPKNVPVDDFYGNTYGPFNKWQDIYLSAKVLLKYKRLPTRRELNALLAYWDFASVFEGVSGDTWLYYTKMEAHINKLIK